MDNFPECLSILATLVRGYLGEPARFDLSYLTHELLRGEDELVVDDPPRLLLGQRAVRVRMDCVLVLHRLVAVASESRRVIEEARCQSLNKSI
uniref:Uncharacterized protein n=1 Tax=Mesocestoides corti TaxID=53468 RepID=A0A5K3EFA8_MESCO